MDNRQIRDEYRDALLLAKTARENGLVETAQYWEGYATGMERALNMAKEMLLKVSQ